MQNKTEHAVYGRRQEDGEWELLAPQMKNAQGGWWIFKYTYREPICILSKEQAVLLAKEAWKEYQDVYQDIMVLEDSGGDSQGNAYCPVCIWQNGSWKEYTVHASSCYDF